MIAQVWVAVVIGVAASIEDLAHRRISNWIPCCAFAAGLLLQSWRLGWRGAASSMLGTLAGFAVFLIFYLLGGMGGGDVKLMAGFGALLGLQKVLEAALWTAACGGVLAALVIAGGVIRGLWRSARSAPVAGEGRKPGFLATESIPYAPAIAAGVWLSLVPKA